MYEIKYKDAGYFEITDGKNIAKLYWDGKIEILSTFLGYACNSEEDFVETILEEGDLVSIKNLYEFTKNIRFQFHFVSCCEKSDFMKEGTKYL